MPRVSVVMPVYNAEAFLQEAVGSILRQTYRDFELIAIDDGSTDGSREMLRQYGKSDSRVKVLDHVSRGLGAVLNYAFSECQGDLIARQDADDRSHPERLERQVAYMQMRPEVVLLGTTATVVDPEGRRLFDRQLPTEDTELREALETGSPFVHGSVMIRRRAVMDAGGYPEIPWLEDLLLWRELAKDGKLANLAPPLYEYRVSPTHLYWPRQFQRQLAAVFRRTWPDNRLSAEDLDLLESIRQQVTPAMRRAQYHLDIAKGLARFANDRAGGRRHLLRALRARPQMPNVWWNLLLNTAPRALQAWWWGRTSASRDSSL